MSARAKAKNTARAAVKKDAAPAPVRSGRCAVCKKAIPARVRFAAESRGKIALYDKPTCRATARKQRQRAAKLAAIAEAVEVVS
jgi:predicted nucleic acid-binding Zn ribbon protein